MQGRREGKGKRMRKPILYQPISGLPYRIPARFFYASKKHHVSPTAKRAYFNF